MAASKKDDKVYARTEIAEAIDETLGADDIWNDIVSDNAVPDVKVKGVVLKQPTKQQVEDWRASTDPTKGEIVLFGQETYDQLQLLFGTLPQSAWTNFNNWYLKHMFGFEVNDNNLGN